MDPNIGLLFCKKNCKYFGISRDTIFAWIDKREIPTTKIGRLRKFIIIEVDACIQPSITAGK